MSAKFIKQILLATVCLLPCGLAFAGVVEQARIPNTSGGMTINCRNPFQMLGIVRTKNSTLVYQSQPAGTQWEVALPAMIAEYDQYWMAPDGSAAVVAVAVQSDAAKAFLVAGNKKPIEIDGVVMSVDFQKNLSLVATADHETNPAVVTTDPESNAGTRVRVYDMDSGRLVGNTWFGDVVPLIMKEFYVRLSGDGKSYYYISQTASGRPIVRDVVSGQKRVFDYQIPGEVDDMLLYSDDRGYIVTSANKAYALGGHKLIPIPQNRAIGPIYQLIESSDSAIQPVKGAKGWGAFDARTGAWLMTEEAGVTSMHSSDAGLTVVSITPDSRSVKTYDFSGAKPKLVRGIGGSVVNDKTLACANAFGFMSYQDGGFTWHRSK